MPLRPVQTERLPLEDGSGCLTIGSTSWIFYGCLWINPRINEIFFLHLVKIMKGCVPSKMRQGTCRLVNLEDPLLEPRLGAYMDLDRKASIYLGATE
jgi:hypothetical protein